MDEKTERLFDLLMEDTLSPEEAYEVLALIKDGAEINARTNKKGNTPLCIAAEKHHRFAVDALLVAGVDIDPKGNLGWPQYRPLHLAALNVDVEIIHTLVKAGAQVEARTKIGYTPLQVALLTVGNHMLFRPPADLSGVNALLAEGASVWAKDNEKSIADSMHAADAGITAHIAKWQPLLNSCYIPKTREEVMHLVSVMPGENNKAIPEPLERAILLLDRMPHTPEINALYETVLGFQRPPEPIQSLQEMRKAAQQQSVGL